MRTASASARGTTSADTSRQSPGAGKGSPQDPRFARPLPSAAMPIAAGCASEPVREPVASEADLRRTVPEPCGQVGAAVERARAPRLREGPRLVERGGVAPVCDGAGGAVEHAGDNGEGGIERRREIVQDGPRPAERQAVGGPRGGERLGMARRVLAPRDEATARTIRASELRGESAGLGGRDGLSRLPLLRAIIHAALGRPEHEAVAGAVPLDRHAQRKDRVGDALDDHARPALDADAEAEETWRGRFDGAKGRKIEAAEAFVAEDGARGRSFAADRARVEGGQFKRFGRIAAGGDDREAEDRHLAGPVSQYDAADGVRETRDGACVRVEIERGVAATQGGRLRGPRRGGCQDAQDAHDQGPTGSSHDRILPLWQGWWPNPSAKARLSSPVRSGEGGFPRDPDDLGLIRAVPCRRRFRERNLRVRDAPAGRGFSRNRAAAHAGAV